MKYPTSRREPKAMHRNCRYSASDSLALPSTMFATAETAARRI